MNDIIMKDLEYEVKEFESYSEMWRVTNYFQGRRQMIKAGGFVVVWFDFGDKVLLYIAKAGLELTLLLPQPPKHREPTIILENYFRIPM
jgi:hypothetical protein